MMSRVNRTISDPYEPTPVAKIIERQAHKAQQQQQQRRMPPSSSNNTPATSSSHSTGVNRMMQPSSVPTTSRSNTINPMTSGTTTTGSSSTTSSMTTAAASNNTVAAADRAAKEREMKKQKERFLIFTRVLLKYLEQKDPELHQRVKAIIKDCAERNKRSERGYESVTASMKARLKEVVNDNYWKRAEAYLNHFLQQKQRTTGTGSAAAGGGGSTSSGGTSISGMSLPSLSTLPSASSSSSTTTAAGSTAVAATAVAVPVDPNNKAALDAAAARQKAAEMERRRQLQHARAAAAAQQSSAASSSGAPNLARGPSSSSSSQYNAAVQQAPPPPQRADLTKRPGSTSLPASSSASASVKYPVSAASTGVTATAAAAAAAAAKSSSSQPGTTTSTSTAGSSVSKPATASKSVAARGKTPTAATSTTAAASVTSSSAAATAAQARKAAEAAAARQVELPREYAEFMEMVDHATDFDWTSVGLMMGQRLHAQLSDEQKNLLYSENMVPTSAARSPLAATSPTATTHHWAGWSQRNVISARVAWARIRLPEQQRQANGSGTSKPLSVGQGLLALPAAVPNPAVTTKSTGSMTTSGSGSSTTAADSATASHSWYNEDTAEDDLTLAVLSQGAELYLKSVLEKALHCARQRQNLDGVRLWHQQVMPNSVPDSTSASAGASSHNSSSSSSSPPQPPLSLRLGCDVSRQLARVAGNSALICKRMEEALERQEGVPARDRLLTTATMSHAQSMSDLALRPLLAKGVHDADLESKRRFEVLGGKETLSEPLLGRVPKKAKLEVVDFQLGMRFSGPGRHRAEPLSGTFSF